MNIKSSIRVVSEATRKGILVVLIPYLYIIVIFAAWLCGSKSPQEEAKEVCTGLWHSDE